MPDLTDRFESELALLGAKSRSRRLTPGNGIDFTSNDFLGLCGSAEMREAVTEALSCGVPLGSGGSRLLRGNHPAHIELEEHAARLFRCEKSLFFANGYSANFAVLTALPRRHDLIVFDALSHASIREGISASFAKSAKAAHNDVDAMDNILCKWHPNRQKDAMAWIVAESLYSMDGDFAPLADLLELADQYDAMLIVDEAHATGVWGENGHGLTEPYESHPNLLAVHTCGKALGAAGALVCAGAALIDYMVNRSRPFIYSTAPPPISAVAVNAALSLIETEPQRRNQLHRLIIRANQEIESKLGTKGSGSQIIPFVVGDDETTLSVARAMQKAGFDVRAIRPPTVPEGTARLRISITLNVSETQISNFFDTLHKVMQSQNPRLP